MIKLDNKQVDQGIWYTYSKDEEVKFLIRPYPASKIGDSETEAAWKELNYCVVDWQGIADTDGNPMPCNEVNKKKLYDYFTPLREFISSKIVALLLDVEKELKNL